MASHSCHQPHQCSECPATFAFKSRLKDHLKTHSEERPFMCEVCGKAFKFASVLESHLTIHTGAKKYQCDVCGRLYRYRASLYIHARMHTGERPYKCEMCPASFLIHSHLTDHLRIHSGVKPFQCEVCVASFSRTIGLQKHLRAHIRKGVEVDLVSAMYRAKLRAKDKSRGSGNDEFESVSSRHTDEESKNEENVLFYTEPLPDEVDVVLTLCSIGDGSICSHSIEKQGVDSRLTAQGVIADKILTARRECALGHEQKQKQGCRYSCNDYTEEINHSAPHNPKSSRICSIGKLVSEDQPARNKTHRVANTETDTAERAVKSSHISKSKDVLKKQLGILHQQQNLSLRCHKEAETENKGPANLPVSLTLCVQPMNGVLECKVLAQTFQGSEYGSLRNTSRGQAYQSFDATSEVTEKQYRCEQEAPYDTVLEIEESDLSQEILHHRNAEDTKETSEKDTKIPHKSWLKENKDKADITTKTSQTQAQDSLRCQYCPKVFRYKSAVRCHERTHTGEKPFQCPECGKSFSKKSNMETHTRVHTGERPFLCDLCGKPFSHKYTLEAHRWLHVEETPFLCGVCGKGFRYENSQKVHLKRHAGEKNFKCDFCPKAFVTKVDLQDHQRVHTKERPYKCEECGHGFMVRHHLLDHRRLHGGGDRPNKRQYSSVTFL